ncbi:hypothetical protein D3C77_682200 [compost metagenome]
MFTATNCIGCPLACHCTICKQACCSTQVSISAISPVRSAIGMNSPGATNPRCGCCQRTKASTPIIAPLLNSCTGW